jgi:ribonuclease P protein component
MKGKSAEEKHKSVKIIKSKKELNAVFNFGKIIYSTDKIFKAYVLIIEDSIESRIYTAAVVNRKCGNGVWRNRLKRLIRESFRQTKNILVDKLDRKNLLIKIVISPYLVNQESNKKIGLKQTLPSISGILSAVSRRI